MLQIQIGEERKSSRLNNDDNDNYGNHNNNSNNIITLSFKTSPLLSMFLWFTTT